MSDNSIITLKIDTQNLLLVDIYNFAHYLASGVLFFEEEKNKILINTNFAPVLFRNYYLCNYTLINNN